MEWYQRQCHETVVRCMNLVERKRGGGGGELLMNQYNCALFCMSVLIEQV